MKCIRIEIKCLFPSLTGVVLFVKEKVLSQVKDWYNTSTFCTDTPYRGLVFNNHWSLLKYNFHHWFAHCTLWAPGMSSSSSSSSSSLYKSNILDVSIAVQKIYLWFQVFCFCFFNLFVLYPYYFYFSTISIL